MFAKLKKMRIQCMWTMLLINHESSIIRLLEKGGRTITENYENINNLREVYKWNKGNCTFKK